MDTEDLKKSRFGFDLSDLEQWNNLATIITEFDNDPIKRRKLRSYLRASGLWPSKYYMKAAGLKENSCQTKKD